MNVEQIRSIMLKKTFLTLSDIKTLTGCSDKEARALRIRTLQTYLPVNGCIGLKTKVRLDKFLEYYDNKFLIKLYEKVLDK